MKVVMVFPDGATTPSDPVPYLHDRLDVCDTERHDGTWIVSSVHRHFCLVDEVLVCTKISVDLTQANTP